MKNLILCLAAFSSFATAQSLAPNAPADKPQQMTSVESFAAYDRATAPYVAEARKTYPEAKRRFLAGVIGKRPFFVTVRLRDGSLGEDAFVRVLRIDAVSGDITGRIASDMQVVKTLHQGQQLVVGEAQVRDWTISNPDGSEEGNVVGKFLDHYQVQK